MFELYLHYYPHKGYPSDIILLDTETQEYWAWLDYEDTQLLHRGWTKIKPIVLRGYVRASPLLFLILTGEDYYSTLPKGASDDQR